MHILLLTPSSVGMDANAISVDPAEGDDPIETFVLGIGEGGLVVRCKRSELPTKWRLFYDSTCPERLAAMGQQMETSKTASCVARLLLTYGKLAAL